MNLKQNLHVPLLSYAILSALQMHSIAQISFLDLAGCWLDLYGMSYHQSGQRHILVIFVMWLDKSLFYAFYFISWISSKSFLWQHFTYWDDWLRLKKNNKGRQFIRPEVCRTYNFGEHVCVSTLSVFTFHLLLSQDFLFCNDLWWVIKFLYRSKPWC